MKGQYDANVRQSGLASPLGPGQLETAMVVYAACGACLQLHDTTGMYAQTAACRPRLPWKLLTGLLLRRSSSRPCSGN